MKMLDFNNSDFWEINKYKKAMFIREKKKKKGCIGFWGMDDLK